MARVPASAVQPALSRSANHLAVELLARLDAQDGEAFLVTATRPFHRRAASRIYRQKAAKGDRSTIRTEGYPELLATLETAPEGEVIVHGLIFADAVYLVLTDVTRTECLGVLRKRRLDRGG